MSFFPASAAQEIDLGEVFIWGDDRSVIPGLAERLFFIYPSLDKDAFLDPARRRKYERSRPLKRIYPKCPSLSLLAGFDSSSGYQLRLSGCTCPCEDSYLGGFISSERESSDLSNDKFNDLSLRIDGRRRLGDFQFALGGRGDFTGYDKKRKIWEGSGGVVYEPGFMTAYFSMKLAGASEEKSAVSGDFSFKASKRFFYYHNLSLNFDGYLLSIDSKSREALSTFISYTNNMYSNIFFSAGLGRGLSKNLEWETALSGKFFGAGLVLEAGRKTREKDFYNLYASIPFLVPDALYPLEEVFYSEGRISYEILKTAFSCGLRYEEVEDRTILVKSLNTASLASLAGRTRTSNILLAAERENLSMRASIPIKSRDLPEEVFTVEATYETPPGKLRADLSARYEDLRYLWLNSSGTLTDKAPSYLGLNGGLTYLMSDSLTVRGGVKNFLSSEIIKSGYLSQKNPRYFLSFEYVF
ncbi:MAG: hypothetical protein GX817_05425 [Elusimicrobia bacterium]|nr:hypothetical protein [Elusimicrobiota bacterium]